MTIRGDRIPTLIERVDLEAEIERRTGPAVRRSGGRATFHCPNPDHADATPSFTVQDGRWRCWSACDRGGDVIDLTMWLDGLTKAEAIHVLARRLGLDRADARQCPSRSSIAPEQANRLLDNFLQKRRWHRDTADLVGLHVVLDGQGRPRVRFPFRRAGEVIWWQDRIVADGEPKWLGRPGPIPCPFEADRIARAHEVGKVFVLEGPADVVGLIDELPDAAAVGIPGAGALKSTWSRAFAGLDHVWTLADNDQAGEKLRMAVERIIGPAVRSISHVRVPQAFGDLDDWRRSVGGEAFVEGLMAAIDVATQPI